MDAMLNRIKTKQGKGKELSPAERAALIDPRAVYQTLQDYGTLTSAEAKDVINFINKGGPAYRDGGVVGTETALVGEEGPELVVGRVVGQSGPEIAELPKGHFVLTAEQTAAVKDALKRKGLTWKQRMGLAALKGG
jgi:hypothetical protein